MRFLKFLAAITLGTLIWIILSFDYLFTGKSTAMEIDDGGKNVSRKNESDMSSL